MKRYISLIICMLFGGIVNAVQVWDGISKVEFWTKGSGTESDPYLIETPAHLAYLRYVLGEADNSIKRYVAQAYYRQTDDFDLDGNDWSPIGSPGETAFSGIYDGDGHYISNAVLSIVTDSKNTNSCYGIFGECQKATLKNIFLQGTFTLKLPTFAVNQKFANFSPLVAVAKECVFIHCVNSSTCNLVAYKKYSGYVREVQPADDFRIGGISAYAEKCLFQNCANLGDWSCQISGSQNYHSAPLFGGIVGYAKETIVRNSYNSGRLSAQMESYQGGAAERCGGIVGRIDGCTIQECYNCGEIVSIYETTSTYPAYPELGGIIGTASLNVSSFVEKCYNIGDIKVRISSSYYQEGKNLKGCMGGIVGSGSYTKLNACYNKNNVTISGQYDVHGDTQSYIAGLIGKASKDTIQNSYTVFSFVRSSPDVNIYGTLSTSVASDCVFENAHYISTAATDQIQGTAQTAEYMKSEAFVNQLNENGTYFRMDTKNENEGFPILGVFSTYQLLVKAGEGGTTQGSGNYAENAQVTISATPSDTYKFIGWSDGSIDNPRTIIVQSDSTLTASFRRTHYAIKVSQDCNVTME